MKENSLNAIMIVGASGSGKSLSIDIVKKINPHFDIFPKHTTRQKRTQNEIDSVHYHFSNYKAFKDMEKNGSFIHIKKSDYDTNQFAISQNELRRFLTENKNPCFTSHSIQEATEVRKILRSHSVKLYILYLYSPESNRIQQLIDTNQDEKLIFRYNTDIGLKLLAYRTSFEECDFVVFNGRGKTSLKERLREICTYLENPLKTNRPIKISDDYLAQISQDVKIITEKTKSIFTSSITDNSIGHITECKLAEYNVLRDEIKQYHSDRTNYVNFSVVLTVGLMVLISSKDITASYRSIILVLVPFIYCILAFLYIDKSFRVIRLADYIENEMRPRLETLLKHPLLLWEHYKRETQIFPRWITKLLDRLRLLIFIGPAVISIVAWSLIYYTASSGIEHSLGIVSSLVIVLALLLNHITQETSGAKNKKVFIPKK